MIHVVIGTSRPLTAILFWRFWIDCAEWPGKRRKLGMRRD